MSVGRKMQPGSDYFHPFFEGAFYGFYSVSGSQPQVPSTSQQGKLSFEGVDTKGGFYSERADDSVISPNRRTKLFS